MYCSTPLRKYVSTLRCVHCGTPYVQVAHRNQSKGLGLKCSDGLVAALCPPEHTRIDQGRDLLRDERRSLMDGYIRKTYAQALRRGDCKPALLAEWKRELDAVGMLDNETQGA